MSESKSPITTDVAQLIVEFVAGDIDVLALKTRRVTLRNCALVSKTWSEFSLDLLWNDDDSSHLIKDSTITKLLAVCVESRAVAGAPWHWRWGTKRFLEYCGRIKRLKLHGLVEEQLSKIQHIRTLAHVEILFPKLREIDACCTAFDGTTPKVAIAIALFGSPALQKFTAHDSSPESLLIVEQLTHRGASITTLALPHGIMAKDYGTVFAERIQAFTELRTLDIPFTALSLAALIAISTLPRLSQLDIHPGSLLNPILDKSTIYLDLMTRKRGQIGVTPIKGFASLQKLRLQALNGVFLDRLIEFAFINSPLQALTLQEGITISTSLPLRWIETLSIIGLKTSLCSIKLHPSANLTHFKLENQFPPVMDDDKLLEIMGGFPKLRSFHFNPRPRECRGLHAPQLSLHVVLPILKLRPSLAHLALCVSLPTTALMIDSTSTKHCSLKTLELGYSFCGQYSMERDWFIDSAAHLASFIPVACSVSLDKGDLVFGSSADLRETRKTQLEYFRVAYAAASAAVANFTNSPKVFTFQS